MIIDKWHKTYYGGSLPNQADSSTRTYELAMALRNIANNDLFFFRETLENAYKKSEDRIKMGLRVIRGKNDSIYSRLPQMFSHAELVAEARKIKGPDVTDNAIKQIIKNWKASELIVPEGDKFKKLR